MPASTRTEPAGPSRLTAINPRTGGQAQPAEAQELRAALNNIHRLLIGLDGLPAALLHSRIQGMKRIASIALRGEEYYK